jgi:hypothetical protein
MHPIARRFDSLQLSEPGLLAYIGPIIARAIGTRPKDPQREISALPLF